MIFHITEAIENTTTWAITSLGLKAAAAALQASGWCPYIYGHLLPELQSNYCPKIATALQKQAVNASGNQQHCIDVVWRQVQVIMKNEIYDPTGLIFRAASGLVPEVGPKLCSDLYLYIYIFIYIFIYIYLII